MLLEFRRSLNQRGVPKDIYLLELANTPHFHAPKLVCKKTQLGVFDVIFYIVKRYHRIVSCDDLNLLVRVTTTTKRFVTPACRVV